jgi:hypothetical protein
MQGRGKAFVLHYLMPVQVEAQPLLQDVMDVARRTRPRGRTIVQSPAVNSMMRPPKDVAADDARRGGGLIPDEGT